MQTELRERILEYRVRTINVVESLAKTLVGRRIGNQLWLSPFALCFFISFVVLDLEKCS
jgi:hypothetical protein